MAATPIQAFEQFLADEGKSLNTIATYSRVLTKLDAWLLDNQTNASLVDLQPRYLLAYMTYLRTTMRAKPATLNLTRGALSAFYKWAAEQGFATENPARRIKTAAATKSAPKALGEGLMHRLMDESKKYERSRDGAIVLLLLMTGLRESELAQLLVEDIDLKNRTMTVYNGKGGKYRELPLTSELCHILASYITGERADMVANLKRPLKRNHLFIGRRGPIARQTVFTVVNTIAQRAGIEGCHPHQLRHTYATFVLNKTGDLTAVSALLGHSSIATTQIYTRPTQERLAERVQSAFETKTNS